MSAVVEIDTPVGRGRLFVDACAPGTARATVVLGHGAGGGVDAPDLVLLSRRLPALGVRVVRFEQPWRTAGQRVAVAPPRLDLAWRAAVDSLVSGIEVPGGGDLFGPLFFGGRSAGARVACRTAAWYDVAGVICLAFPLHPPGRLDRSRAAELSAPSVPRLVLQGSRDAFGGAAEIRRAIPDDAVEVVELPGADHSFRVAASAPGTTAELQERVVGAVDAFVSRHLAALPAHSPPGE